MISETESRLTLKDESIAARTDGSLQIEVHDPQTGGRMWWPRHYYVLPLEVNSISRKFNHLGKTFLPRAKGQGTRDHKPRPSRFCRPNLRRNVRWSMS